MYLTPSLYLSGESDVFPLFMIFGGPPKGDGGGGGGSDPKNPPGSDPECVIARISFRCLSSVTSFHICSSKEDAFFFLFFLFFY